MKKFIKIALFMGFISMNAQNDTLTDYNWTIEKIVTDEEVLIADQEENVYDILYLQDTDINDQFLFYEFSSCDGQIEISQSEQSFELLLWGCAITPEHTDIGLFFYSVFLSEESNEVIGDEGGLLYGPFTYEFREENELLYLDITNPEGSVATFWANTLTNENFEEDEFSIYPNPVSDQLHMESERSQIQQVEIFNLNGKLVLDVGYQESQPIDVSSLAKGIYLVKIQTEKGSLTKKLVKE